MVISPAFKKYLKSEAWARKRNAVFARYGRKCYACGTAKGAIQVHHLTYERIGRELVSDLLPLCVKCHREVTKIYRRNRRVGLRKVTIDFVRTKKMAAAKKAGK